MEFDINFVIKIIKLFDYFLFVIFIYLIKALIIYKLLFNQEYIFIISLILIQFIFLSQFKFVSPFRFIYSLVIHKLHSTFFVYLFIILKSYYSYKVAYFYNPLFNILIFYICYGE
jgi:hypothetical protein